MSLCTRICVGLLLSSALCVVVAEVQLQCPEDVGDQCKEQNSTKPGWRIYHVNGFHHDMAIQYKMGSHFTLHCDEDNNQLHENNVMPRFTEMMRVRNVTLNTCALPNGTYVSLLTALNVSVTNALVLENIPDTQPLRADHFVGLTSLKRLVLSPQMYRSIKLESGALEPLIALQDLVEPDINVESLPSALRSLKLTYTWLKNYTPVTPNLQVLQVRAISSFTVDVKGVPALRILNVYSSGTIVKGLQLPELQEFIVNNWDDTRPQQWLQCDNLKKLVINCDQTPFLWDISISQKVPRVLPEEWVSRCPVLTVLSVQGVYLASLPPRLLHNSKMLNNITITMCFLTEIPMDFFMNLDKVIWLNLSYNQLKKLPSGLFSPLVSLRELNLSDNMLTTLTVTTVLQPLSSLTTLLLANNKQLSDLCEPSIGTTGTTASSLHHMTNLTRLVLRETGVTRVCQDWRENMTLLQELDLTDTEINVFQYDDVVKWRRVKYNNGEKMKSVIYYGRNTVHFSYSRNDYERAITETSDYDTDIIIEMDSFSNVFCDCSAYWAALVFRTSSLHASRIIPKPSCYDLTYSLHDVPLDELTCVAPELCTASSLENCTCFKRDDVQVQNGVATAYCENQGLTRVPGPLQTGPVWRLLFNNNSISRINVSELPTQWSVLDLSRNQLQVFDQEVAATVLCPPEAKCLMQRRVLLNNNPLRCDCDALVPLSLLVVQPKLVDWKDVTCTNESAILLERLTTICAKKEPKINIVSVSLSVVIPSGLVVIMVVLMIAKPELRLRVIIVLSRAGCWPRQRDVAGNTEDGRLYDAFVSYSHEDEEWVRSTLVDRLEAGPAPYKLCVHYRDWMPGQWIPAQIAASVRTSRRTLVVMSQHFLNSDWALLEFREAYTQARRDVTPRLIVLLLEDPKRLQMDPEMRSFIKNNTYVRWEDPWFWRKLEHAMPVRSQEHLKSLQVESSPEPYSSD